MYPYRIVSACMLLALAVGAAAGQGPPPGTDGYGDPLPRDAVARLGTVRFRHDSTIVFAAFLPGGKGALSVSDDGVICAWEFPSGKAIRRFEAFAETKTTRVAGVKLSPDGKHLAADCTDGYLRIVDWANAKELGKVVNRAPGPSALALARALAMSSLALAECSPDGKTLMLLGSPRVLQMVDLPTGKEIGPNQGHTWPLTSVAFTPDGRQILTTDDQGFTYAWNVAASKDLRSSAIKLPATPGTPTVLSPDGRVGVSVARFATFAAAQAAKARAAIFFDTADGKEIGQLALEAAPTSVTHVKPILFSPDGKMLAVNSSSDGKEKIALHEVPGGKLLRTLDAGPGAPANAGMGKGKGGGGFGGIGGGFGAFTSGGQGMLFSPDGKAIAFQPGRGAPIVVLNTATGKQIAALSPRQDSPVLHGVFSTDGRCLALVKIDGTAALYELATGQPRSTFGSNQPARPAINDDLPAALLGFKAASVQPKVNVAIAPDGKALALSGTDGAVHVWDVLSAKELAVFKGHTMAVNALAFAPNGKTLASASDDTTTLIWDVTTITRPALSAQKLKPADLQAWWQTLDDNDASKAFTAMRAFTAAPKDAVAWIKDRVQPAAPLDMKRVEDLLQQLDSDQFKVRDTATRDLLKLDEQLVPALDKALAADPSLESKQRLEGLRDKMTGVVLQGERLRAYRAIEVLERIGTPEARDMLRELAEGAPGALITTSAQAALKR